MNLYDILLARCICSNKEDESITVTPLEVTENGEYEAEEGYAYNPVTVDVGGGGGGMKTATLTATCTNPDVSEVFINYYFIVNLMTYYLDGGPMSIEGGAIDLIVGEDNRAYFVGLYNDTDVNLNLESVSGEGEIKENAFGGKYLEIHGDCAVTLSYTP